MHLLRIQEKYFFTPPETAQQRPLHETNIKYLYLLTYTYLNIKIVHTIFVYKYVYSKLLLIHSNVIPRRLVVNTYAMCYASSKAQMECAACLARSCFHFEHFGLIYRCRLNFEKSVPVTVPT